MKTNPITDLMTIDKLAKDVKCTISTVFGPLKLCISKEIFQMKNLQFVIFYLSFLFSISHGFTTLARRNKIAAIRAAVADCVKKVPEIVCLRTRGQNNLSKAWNSFIALP